MVLVFFPGFNCLIMALEMLDCLSTVFAICHWENTVSGFIFCFLFVCPPERKTLTQWSTPIRANLSMRRYSFEVEPNQMNCINDQ